MKKLGLILLFAFFLAGCGTAAKESEFWKHSSMYEGWDHMRFSIWGYKNPTDKTLKESSSQDWWGIPVETK